MLEEWPQFKVTVALALVLSLEHSLSLISPNCLADQYNVAVHLLLPHHFAAGDVVVAAVQHHDLGAPVDFEADQVLDLLRKLPLSTKLGLIQNFICPCVGLKQSVVVILSKGLSSSWQLTGFIKAKILQPTRTGSTVLSFLQHLQLLEHPQTQYKTFVVKPSFLSLFLLLPWKPEAGGTNALLT